MEPIEWALPRNPPSSTFTHTCPYINKRALPTTLGLPYQTRGAYQTPSENLPTRGAYHSPSFLSINRGPYHNPQLPIPKEGLTNHPHIHKKKKKNHNSLMLRKVTTFHLLNWIYQCNISTAHLSLKR